MKIGLLTTPAFMDFACSSLRLVAPPPFSRYGRVLPYLDQFFQIWAADSGHHVSAQTMIRSREKL